MKLLVDCTPLRAGGGVQVAIAFLDGLLGAETCDWRVVVPEQMTALLPEQLRIAIGDRMTVMPKSGLPDMIRIGMRLRRIERDFGADVVFTVFGPAYFSARAPHLVGFALGTMLYDRPPGLSKPRWRERLATLVRAMLVRRVPHLVVETETVKRRLQSHLGVPTSRTSVIGNSVSPLLLRSQPRQPASAARTIFIPSSFYPHKNLGIVVPVMAALRSLRPELDFSVQMTLESNSQGWIELLEQARKAEVADRLLTFGTLDPTALAEAYNAASIVFLPTLCESSTAVYPEAFHFRRPLVTSDLDFARELCGEAALFIPPHDPAAIALAIADLYDDPDLATRLTTAGTKRLETGYPTPARKFAMQLDLLKRLANAKLESSHHVL
jgi:glycosyltransferase involved in cell wall biosynthesis